jgi:superfamily II DNA or RNA helicase
MNRNETKDKIQRAGLNKWFQSGCKGTLEYATGVGKTRCGVLAASHFADKNDNLKVIILTPTETIRDRAWKDEFKKWGESKLFEKNVETICIQSAYKLHGEHYDLVICDEIHNAIAPEYMKFFHNNIYDKILGLSASISKEKRSILENICPVIDSISTSKAVSLGLISPFKMYNIGVKLTPQEQAEYDKANQTFTSLFPLFDRDINTMFRCLNSSYFRNYCGSRGVDYEQVKRCPYMCKNAMNKRKDLIYDASAKIEIVKQLSDHFPSRLGIIFGQTVKFADLVTEELGDKCVSFHSKVSAKQRKENLKRLQDGRTKVNRISTAKALNEGANIPECSMGIIAAGTSKPKETIQRIGRSVRWEKDKIALIFRIYVKNSQEERWLESAQYAYDAINVDSVEEVLKIEGTEKLYFIDGHIT